MYVYDCNASIMTAAKKRSEKEMIQAFTELTGYLKIRRNKPAFHFMEN